MPEGLRGPAFFSTRKSSLVTSRSGRSIRADKSSSDSNTTALPSLSNRPSSAAARFRIAPPGRMKILQLGVAGCFEIDKARFFIGDRFEFSKENTTARGSGRGREMNDRVGRAADGQQHPQRVLDRFLGDDFGWTRAPVFD